MFAVLGASGHVGTAVTEYLLQQGQAVTVVLRNPQKAAAWAQRGASVALVDVHDTDALAQVLQKADRAFVLNPPASPALDTDKAERATVQSILQALRGAKLEKLLCNPPTGRNRAQSVQIWACCMIWSRVPGKRVFRCAVCVPRIT